MPKPGHKLMLMILLAATGGVAAQQTGPIPPPKQAPSESATQAAPSLPVEEIITRFAANEAEFRKARDEYSYKQLVVVRDFDLRDVDEKRRSTDRRGRGRDTDRRDPPPDPRNPQRNREGRPGGEYRRQSEVIFLPNGERFERVTYEPPSTLEFLGMTPEDLRDMENIQPFVLTTEDLPKYDVRYEGREQIDELTTYRFRVAPKRMEAGQRYFEGQIWVDDVDLQIVKTRGKAVPDVRKGKENLFPVFETYRENIDGQYWFPTYTSADDVLHFKNGDMRIKVLIRYTEYKKREVQVRILSADPTPPPKP